MRRSKTGLGLVANERLILSHILATTRNALTVAEILRHPDGTDTGPVLTCDEATVYRVLDRFHKRGWVERRWRTSDNDARPAREFVLTAAGRQAAEQLADGS